MNNSVGEKIRNYRKRLKTSQLELEAAIDASNGMISRIESNEVNPTKETLFKIAEALKLDAPETADLFGIEVVAMNTQDDQKKEQIETDFGLVKVLKLTTNQWVKLLGVEYAVIWLWNEQKQELKLESVTAPQIALSLATKAMGKSYENLILSAHNTDQKQNDYIKCIEVGEIISSKDFSTVSHTFISKDIARIIQKVLKMKLSVTIPLILNDQRLGVLGLIWEKDSFTEQDKALLGTFAEQISITIYNASLLIKA